MSRPIHDATACREALARLPELDLGELRRQWRALYKTAASPHLSRELLMRAVAHRMQELALGGLRPERQRQLRQFARQLKEGGATRIRARPELQRGGARAGIQLAGRAARSLRSLYPQPAARRLGNGENPLR